MEQLVLAFAIGSFGMMNTGYLMEAQDVSWGLFALMQCVIAAVTFGMFQNAPCRFLAGVWSIVSIVIWLTVSREDAVISIPVFAIPLAALTTCLWIWRTRPEVLNPLAYAAAFSLPGTVLFFSLVRDMQWLRPSGAAMLGALGIRLGLLTLVAALNLGTRSLTSPWLIGLVIVTLPLVWAGEMGVLTAMFPNAAAFAWGDKMLGAFAWIFLADFLFFFYFDMEVPLYIKSAFIGGSGLAFPIIRTILVKLQPSASKA